MKLIDKTDIQNCKLFCNSLINCKINVERLCYQFNDYFELDDGIIEIGVNGEYDNMDNFTVTNPINKNKDGVDEYEINYLKIIEESRIKNELCIDTEESPSLSIFLLVKNDIVKDVKYKIFDKIEVSKDAIKYAD